jgi:hypothetical protein
MSKEETSAMRYQLPPVCGHDNIVRMVLNKGADSNAPGSEKENALQVAARCFRRASFGCCLRRGQTNEFDSSPVCAAAPS